MPIYEDGIETVAAYVIKEVELGVGPITSGVPHTLPNGQEYVLGDGANMDVYLGGQLLAEGATEDYEETTTTSITFNFNVAANSNITYFIRC